MFQFYLFFFFFWKGGRGWGVKTLCHLNDIKYHSIFFIVHRNCFFNGKFLFYRELSLAVILLSHFKVMFQGQMHNGHLYG